jgi:hypothetical protein
MSGISMGDAAAISGTYAPTFTNRISPTLFAHSASYLSTGVAGTCQQAVFFNKDLTDSEIRSLFENPWQIYKGVTARIYSFPSAAVASTVGPKAYHHRHHNRAG